MCRKSSSRLSSALKERDSIRPFGIYITKQNSPVQPERFTGYHAGTDFETFPEEKDTDVVINAICDGKLSMSAIKAMLISDAVMPNY
jgi:hypothetical protein